MDLEKAKRLQSIRVIISEAIMVIAVILAVIVLGFLVSGYWINSNFEVERQGLLQISSIPTGANISIDGNESSWLERTNTSKVLSSGEHTILLSKEGYDSWTKTINIQEGLLYRIHYPRLFPNEREKENVLNVANTSITSVSPDHNYILLINNTNGWSIINLDSENIKPIKLSVSELFSDTATNNSSQENPITEKILDIKWDYDCNHVLAKTKVNDKIEWVLIDIKNTKNSINLTRDFGNDFSEVQILDNSSNNLIAVQNNNLHKINVSDKILSNVLVKNIVSFDHFNQNEIIFSTKNSLPESEEKYYVGIIKIGDNKITKLKDTTTPAKVTLSKFYDDKYVTILEDNQVSLYKYDNFIKVSDFELSFIPNTMKVGHSGEFIIMTLGSQIATLDMESTSMIEWSTDNDIYNWIDNDMIYSVSNNSLIVYDYDGFNRRIIANDVLENSPSAITGDKWLYYFNNEEFLVRESLIR